jgi:hypothetical protein
MPMTAAEKRCATAATTASSAAFGRSTRRQAITMEIFANRLSANRRLPPPDAARPPKLRRDLTNNYKRQPPASPATASVDQKELTVAGLFSGTCRRSRLRAAP